MAATIEISLPDTLVQALDANPSDLPRWTLEAVVSQAYRSGKITHAQVGEILHLDRWQTDAFLNQTRAYRPSEPQEFLIGHP